MSICGDTTEFDSFIMPVDNLEYTPKYVNYMDGDRQAYDPAYDRVRTTRGRNYKRFEPPVYDKDKDLQGRVDQFKDGSGLARLNIDVFHGMVEYSNFLDQHLGKTLRSIGITLDREGPYHRANILTWYFHTNVPGAFVPYDPDGTIISDFFIHRAATWQFGAKEIKDNHYG